MEVYNRKSVFSEIGDACHLSKPNDFIEVTDWKNGEGYDICIQSTIGQQIISITYGEFKLLKKMIKTLDKRMSNDS